MDSSPCFALLGSSALKQRQNGHEKPRCVDAGLGGGRLLLGEQRLAEVPLDGGRPRRSAREEAEGGLHLRVSARGSARIGGAVDGEAQAEVPRGEALEEPGEVEVEGGGGGGGGERGLLGEGLELHGGGDGGEDERVVAARGGAGEGGDVEVGVEAPEPLLDGGDDLGGGGGGDAEEGGLRDVLRGGVLLALGGAQEGAALVGVEAQRDGAGARPGEQPGEVLAGEAEALERVELRGDRRVDQQVDEQVLVVVLVLDVGREGGVAGEVQDLLHLF